MKKKKCALCGKEYTDIELQMSNGTPVCFNCAKEIYTAVVALATFIKHEELER